MNQPLDFQSIFSPRVVDPLDIPSRSLPIPSEPDVFGLNVGAVKDTFPGGLQVFLPRWNLFNLGDAFTIWLNDLKVVTGYVGPDDLDQQRVQRFIAAVRFSEGPAVLRYDVTRPGATFPEPSPEMKVFVKLTRPGGQDLHPDPGHHSELHFTLPVDVELGGVDLEMANRGVWVTVQPYPFMAVNDVIRLSWGGIIVLHTVTLNEVRQPIPVFVNKDVIFDAGDSLALTVSYEVLDRTNNRSEDWAAAKTIVVDTGSSRLAAPFVLASVNGVLNMDTLRGAPIKLLVFAVSDEFKASDQIVARLRGTTQDGAAVDIELEPFTIPYPSAYELEFKHEDVLKLLRTQVVFSFSLIKADGSGTLKSKGAFVHVTGTIRRLPAPIIQEAFQDSVDPNLPRVHVILPWHNAWKAGDTLKLQWDGTRQGGSSYRPDLGTRTISTNEAEDEAMNPIVLTVDGEHLQQINLGTLVVFYELYSEKDRVTTMEESIHGESMLIGKRTGELPAPEVLGVLGGELDPTNYPNGTLLTVLQYPGQQAGDQVFCSWLGSGTGLYGDSITLTSSTAQYPVPFTIKASLLEGNRDGEVHAAYRIKRASGERDYSKTLTFNVGRSVLKLPKPFVTEAPGDLLDLASVESRGAKLVVKYDGMRPSDLISYCIDQYTSTQTTNGNSSGRIEFAWTRDLLALHLLGKRSVTVYYAVVRNGVSKTSEPLTLNIKDFGETARWTAPYYTAAVEGVLDTSKLTADAELIQRLWHYIRIGQTMWLTLYGVGKDGQNLPAYRPLPWQGAAVGNVTSDKSTQIARTWLSSLKDNSILRTELEVVFNGTTKVLLPVGRVTIKAQVLEKPVITQVIDNSGGITGNVANGGTTDDTTPTLVGSAAPNSTVVLFDGSLRLAEAPVGSDRIWRRDVTVSSGTHNIVAKTMNAEYESAVWKFTVQPDLDYVSNFTGGSYDGWSRGPGASTGVLSSNRGFWTFLNYTDGAGPHDGVVLYRTFPLVIGARYRFSFKVMNLDSTNAYFYPYFNLHVDNQLDSQKLLIPYTGKWALIQDEFVASRTSAAFHIVSHTAQGINNDYDLYEIVVKQLTNGG